MKLFYSLLAGSFLAWLPMSQAHAQATPLQVQAANVAAGAPLPGALLPGQWYKIGKNFGNQGHWQFGFDTSLTATACIGYDFVGKAILGGTCRRGLVLARQSVPFMHIGGGVVWDASHAHGSGILKGGLNVGQTNSAFLDQIGSDVPSLEGLTGWKAPAWAQYLGNITTVDGFGGPHVDNFKKWSGGVMVDATVPLADIWALVSGK